MPVKRHSPRILRRILAANARKTTDISRGRSVGPFGSNFEEVVVSEECGETALLASGNAGVATVPGTSVPILRPLGGSQGLVLASSPPGRGGVGPIQSSESEVDVGVAATEGLALLFVGFIGRPSTTSSTFRVGYYNDGAQTELHASLTIPNSHTIDNPDTALRQPHNLTVIYDDDAYPDGSFVISAGGSFGVAEYLYIFDISTGVAAQLYDGSGLGGGELIIPGSVWWNSVEGKINFAAVDNVTNKVRRVSTGASLELLDSFASSGSNAANAAVLATTARWEIIHNQGGA